MKQDHWESLYKDQAKENTTNPPDHIWQNVELTLDRKKRRTPFLFWFLAGALILASGTGYYFWKSDNAIVSSVEVKEIGVSETSAIKSRSEHPARQDEKFNDVTHVTPGTNRIMESNIENSKEKINTDDYVNSLSGQKKGSNLYDKASHSTSRTTYDRSGHSTLYDSHSASKVGKPNIVSNENQISTDRNEIRIDGVNSQENGLNILTNGTKSYKTVEKISDENEIGSKSLPASKTSLNVLHPLASYSAEKLKVDELNFKPLLMPKNVKCPTFKKRNRIIPHVQLEAGIGLPMRHLTQDNEPSKIFTNKLVTDRPWYSYNASVQVGAILRNSMTLQGGINYTEVKEKFDYQKSGLTRIVINLDINTGQPIDTTLETGRVVNSGENRFKMLNIPLTIGYQKKMKNWILAGEVGAGINLSLSASGKVLYYDDQVHYLDEVADFYKKQIGLTLNAAVAIHYLLNDRTTIYIKPQYVLSMKDWTVQNIGFKSSYALMNVNIGIRRSF